MQNIILFQIRHMKFLQILSDVIGWIEITAGCFLGISLLGAALCQVFPAHERFTVFLVFSLIGLILGASWASLVWKKHGTMEWLSSIRRIS